MINWLKKLFSPGVKIDYAQLMKEGAILLDVRSRGEFDAGHIKGAMNIPVEQLRNHLAKLKDKDKPIITCCASGMRSASARALLRSAGYAQVLLELSQHVHYT